MEKFRKNLDEGRRLLKMRPLKKEKYKYQQFLTDEEKFDFIIHNGYNHHAQKPYINKDVYNAEI